MLKTSAVALCGLLLACAAPSRPSADTAPAAVTAPARPPRPQRPAPVVVFDRASPYGRVLVLDEGPLRVMRLGDARGADQSAIVRGDPDAVPVEYIRYALLGLAHHGNVRRILMVGLGGGTFSTLVHRALPDVSIDVVEINPLVVEAARSYFGLREDGRQRVFVADAAVWIARDRATYDYVLLDAYAGDDIPAVLGGQAFFRDVRRRLAPGGVVAINVADLNRAGLAVVRAFSAVFAPFDCRQTPIDGNLVLFAASGPRPDDRAAAIAWAERFDAHGAASFSLRILALSPTTGRQCAHALGRTR